jgi:hypothetical protein
VVVPTLWRGKRFSLPRPVGRDMSNTFNALWNFRGIPRNKKPRWTARAVQRIRAGTPVVVRSEKDGSREVLWAPEGPE